MKSREEYIRESLDFKKTRNFMRATDILGGAGWGVRGPVPPMHVGVYYHDDAGHVTSMSYNRTIKTAKRVLIHSITFRDIRYE